MILIEISAIQKIAGIVIHSLSGGLCKGQKNNNPETRRSDKQNQIQRSSVTKGSRSGRSDAGRSDRRSNIRGFQSPNEQIRPHCSTTLSCVPAQHTTRARGKQAVQTRRWAPQSGKRTCRVQLTSSGLKRRATTALVQSHQAHARHILHFFGADDACSLSKANNLGVKKQFY